MNWIKLQVEDLCIVLNKNQLDLLNAELAKRPERDFASDILNSAVALARAKIASSGINTLDVDHSRIPLELRECVLRLAAESLQARIPALELSKSQLRQSDLARETLEKVERGILPVSRPFAGVKTANPRRGLSSGRGSTNKTTRKTLEGL